MRDKRGYVPAEWMDEMPPRQGTHPDDFLRRTDGGLVLRALDPDEVEYDLSVKDGQVVQFSWHEDRGSRIATIRSETDYDLDQSFDADTNCFCDASGLIEVDNDLADVIRTLAVDAFECGFSLPVDREVEGWVWSEEWYRLSIRESGAGHFVFVPPLGTAVAMKLISDERKRQIEVEGWSTEHDDKHADGELLNAAGAYLLTPHVSLRDDGAPLGWPWEPKWWKPKNERSNLIRAGALCLAESERLQRLNPERSRSHVWAKLDQAIERLARLPT